jgi:hypothetical protein
LSKDSDLVVGRLDTLAKEYRELEIRLNEALQLADDKDKALEKQRIMYANLEVEFGEAKKLQISYDEIKRAYDELLEVERLRTSRSDFHKATTTILKRPWIAAVNALHFYKQLNRASIYAIEHNDPWKKIFFDITQEDGQIIAAKLEGEEEGKEKEK